MHDVGKLVISNRILDKPDALTVFEYARVNEHPLFTQWVLERVGVLAELARVASATTSASTDAATRADWALTS